MYNIHLLPASFGDSILIEYGDPETPHYILIDGGPFFAFENIDKVLRTQYPKLKKIELLVVSHVDIDHIDGIVVMLNQEKLPYEIGEIWFNGYNELAAVTSGDELGAKQGEYLSTLITELDLKHNQAFDGPVLIDGGHLPEIKLDGGMVLTLVSPTKESLSELKEEWEETMEKAGLVSGDAVGALERLKEDKRYVYEPDDVLGDPDFDDLLAEKHKIDKSPANRSSIGFLATYGGKTCLFAGDTPSDLVIESIEKMEDPESLSLDAWKLAHHGSKKSTHPRLMEIIDCKKMLVSSDGKRYRHPDPEVIAKLIDKKGPGVELYFNYKTQYNDYWDKEKYKERHEYNAFFSDDGESGIKISL